MLAWGRGLFEMLALGRRWRGSGIAAADGAFNWMQIFIYLQCTLSLSLAYASTLARSHAHRRTHTNARSRFVYGLHIFYWALATTTLTKPRTTATACCHNVFTSLLLSILACGKGLEENTNTYRLGTLNRAVKQLATLRPDSICTSRFNSDSFHARFNTFATNLLMAFQPSQPATQKFLHCMEVFQVNGIQQNELVPVQ